MINFIVENAAAISTVLFFAVFCYVIFFAFKKSNKKKFEDYAKIALK